MATARGRPTATTRSTRSRATWSAVSRSLARPPVLIGASLGGIAALAAIAETPPPPIARALVLVDVAPRIEAAGVARIGDFMTGNLDGFASLDEVADLIQQYNPHRPRPKDLSGLKKNLRQRADGRWAWHWDPRFVSGRFGSPDETRSSLLDGHRLVDAARGRSRCRRCSCAAGSATC